MCQLYDFSYALPLIPRRATASAAPSPTKRGASEDSHDGESWCDTTSCATGDNEIPLWSLSSFHAAPLLMNTFLGIVERDRELSGWRTSCP
eukprot:GGOE01045782.1.p5 GENE.GGOE01045782.1~~GGOE01045782.1.p5  ORF type:complete len:102 (-),score=13.42 GGOE01045782.1:619-891(-)